MSVNHATDFVKRQAHTTDAFLGGKLSILQPEKGFRAGQDSVLLGAAVSSASRRLLDLGAGAGVAALVAMAHNPSLSAVLAERNLEMAAFARANVAGNGMEARAHVLELDATVPGKERVSAGLDHDHFTSVIANPPFFADAEGTHAPQASRAQARHMQADTLALWVRTAASAAGRDGEIIFIHRAEALPSLLAAFASRFGEIAILPIAARPGEKATRVLIKARRNSRAPLQLLAPFVLHHGNGNGFQPEAEAIFRGEALLDWYNRS
jgi:tRNA1(Val) A37 N6-methylase TrmN6